MNLKSKWDELPARTKHITIIGGAVALVVVAAMVFGDNSPSTPFSSSEPEDKNISVFNTNSARETGIDGLASQVRQMKKANEALMQRLDRISEENEGLTEAVKNATEAEALSKALADIRGEVGMIKQENENLQTLVEEYRSSPSNGTGGQFADNSGEFQQNEEEGDYGIWEPDGTAVSAEPDNEYVVSTNPMKDFEESVPPTISTSEEGFDGGSGESSGSTQPRMITSVTASEPEVEDDGSDDSDGGTMIPAGSIVSGVLLTGMDAPTGSGARQDPFPATIRINKEAILPNRFRADIRECFMLISGHGDLSSERAYLRSETISCVREDGGVIETGLKGYASGEDGKAGVRGRLVSKQGSIIAKSLMAGFMSGAAEAFDVDPVPVLQTSNSGETQQYQSNYDPKLVQGAVSQGASSAMERIAEFYIEMAEGMYPVIEISAGRQIDVIVTSGAQLKIQG